MIWMTADWEFGSQHPVSWSRSQSPLNSTVVTGKGKPLSAPEATSTDLFLPACPARPPAQFQFGPVRSGRSVFTSSTEDSRKSLIVFDFFHHHPHHCNHRFGRRFGITGKVKSAAEKCLQIFDLRPIENGVRASVNP